MKRTREDIEREVTERILESLRDGTVPWARPWSTAGLLPTSVASGRPYRGINTLILGLTALEHDYGSPLWLTYKQASERGGHIRKGEHGTAVIFWKRLRVADRDHEGETKVIPLMRTFTVFNLDQTEGVDLPPRFRALTEREPVDVPTALGDILEGYADGPTLEHRAQGSAYYDPARDAITLPPVDAFRDGTAYAGTALHELTHSTGHPKRLDRWTADSSPMHFGSGKYAREELVAELGSAMLAAVSGIPCEVEQSAAYVASWLEALENDHGLIITAAQQAQKACDRILGTTFEAESEVAA
jgi:antirestriction protein ArdC